MRSGKNISLLVSLVAFFILPFGLLAQEKVDLKMMTGPMGGAWYPLGGAIAEAASSIIDLAADRKIRLVSLPDDKLRILQNKNSGYLKRIIPRGTYPGVDYDVQTAGYFAHLVISAKLPEDLVYRIMKSFAKNLPRFGDVVKDMKGVTPKDLALDIGIPFHPGALKYFKEAGAL
jgi:TRAP-type uncharacterized transport system substrate-binding protein